MNNVDFCLFEANDFWTAKEIKKVKKAFDGQRLVEKKMGDIMVRMLQSPYLQQEHSKLVNAFKVMMPQVLSIEENEWSRTLDGVVKQLGNNRLEFGPEFLKKLNAIFQDTDLKPKAEVNYSEYMHARNFLIALQAFLEINPKVNPFPEPDKMAIEVVKRRIKINDILFLSRNYDELKKFKKCFGIVERTFKLTVKTIIAPKATGLIEMHLKMAHRAALKMELKNDEERIEQMTHAWKVFLAYQAAAEAEKLKLAEDIVNDFPTFHVRQSMLLNSYCRVTLDPSNRYREHFKIFAMSLAHTFKEALPQGILEEESRTSSNQGSSTNSGEESRTDPLEEILSCKQQ